MADLDAHLPVARAFQASSQRFPVPSAALELAEMVDSILESSVIATHQDAYVNIDQNM
jgi:hypothetical protein